MPSFGYRKSAVLTENLQPPPTGGIIARVLPSLNSVKNPSIWEIDFSFRRNWRYSRGFPASSRRYSFSLSPCFAVKRSRRFRTFVPAGTSTVSSRRLTNSRTEAKYWIFTFKGSYPNRVVCRELLGVDVLLPCQLHRLWPVGFGFVNSCHTRCMGACCRLVGV